MKPGKHSSQSLSANRMTTYTGNAVLLLLYEMIFCFVMRFVSAVHYEMFYDELGSGKLSIVNRIQAERLR
jgi:hypothetical protein